MSRHTIVFNEPQEIMLQELMKEFGFKQQEVFRFMLYEMHRKKKPPYNKLKPEIDPMANYSPQKICTDLMNGTVVGDKCVIPFPSGAGNEEIELSQIKKIYEQRVGS